MMGGLCVVTHAFLHSSNSIMCVCVCLCVHGFVSVHSKDDMDCCLHIHVQDSCINNAHVTCLFSHLLRYAVLE